MIGCLHNECEWDGVNIGEMELVYLPKLTSSCLVASQWYEKPPLYKQWGVYQPENKTGCKYQIDRVSVRT
jgi:hypothetical protein